MLNMMFVGATLQGRLCFAHRSWWSIQAHKTCSFLGTCGEWCGGSVTFKSASVCKWTKQPVELIHRCVVILFAFGYIFHQKSLDVPQHFGIWEPMNHQVQNPGPGRTPCRRKNSTQRGRDAFQRSVSVMWRSISFIGESQHWLMWLNGVTQATHTNDFSWGKIVTAGITNLLNISA